MLTQKRMTHTSPRELATCPPVSIAPMMEKTDRHYRYFMRQITRATLLYTEMITTGAIIHGDRDHLLGFHPEEHPISLQLGGDDPDEIYRSVEIAEEYGYDEFNINVGCPSDRVQNKHFGACLMATPPDVREIVHAMRAATDKPVTVKHRIGIDGRESYEEMLEFVDVVNEARPDRFTVHARIAILAGLSPKENRNVPPLRYEDVYRLKKERPELPIEINGHIGSYEDIAEHLEHVDAVMIGRAAYDNPWLFSEVDERYFARPRSERRTRRQVIEAMVPYLRSWSAAGWPARNILRHMLGLLAFQQGTRQYKQRLSGPLPDTPSDVARLLEQSIAHVRDEILDR